LLDHPHFASVEQHFDKRIEEMDAMADIVNIYVLCEPEIRQRARSNGLDIVINLYLDYLRETEGSSLSTMNETPVEKPEERDDRIVSERTLANNWKRLKPAAIFHYLHIYQSNTNPVFSVPSAYSDDFAIKILEMSDKDSVNELVKANDYISNRLNHAFELDLPIIDAPPPKCELRVDQTYRKKLLKLLK
jgi:hypothetical protein